MQAWIAQAEYSDGTSVEKFFPYLEDGNYSAEEEKQYQLESWLLSRHDGCTWYSVYFVEDDSLYKA